MNSARCRKWPAISGARCGPGPSVWRWTIPTSSQLGRPRDERVEQHRRRGRRALEVDLLAATGSRRRPRRGRRYASGECRAAAGPLAGPDGPIARAGRPRRPGTPAHALPGRPVHPAHGPRLRDGSALPGDPVLGDERGRLGAPLEVELREDRADVVLDRLVRQEDLGRDLLVRLALGDEQQDLAAPARSAGPARRCSVPVAIRRTRSRTFSVTAGSSSDSPRPTASSAATRSRARICLSR